MPDDDAADWVEEGEARLFRQDAEWEEAARRRVGVLLRGLNAFDRWRELIPWVEVVRWKLARR